MYRMVTIAFTAVNFHPTRYLQSQHFLILEKFEKTQRRIGGGLRLYFQCSNGWMLTKTTEFEIDAGSGRFRRPVVRFYESLVERKLRSPRL